MVILHIKLNNNNKGSFIAYLRKYLNSTIKRIIINNRHTLNRKLKPLNVTYVELLENLDKLIYINPYSGGLLLGFNTLLRVKSYHYRSLIKAIDFGSQLTGSAYPIFTPVLKYTATHGDIIYGRFIGVR